MKIENGNIHKMASPSQEQRWEILQIIGSIVAFVITFILVDGLLGSASTFAGIIGTYPDARQGGILSLTDNWAPRMALSCLVSIAIVSTLRLAWGKINAYFRGTIRNPIPVFLILSGLIFSVLVMTSYWFVAMYDKPGKGIWGNDSNFWQNLGSLFQGIVGVSVSLGGAVVAIFIAHIANQALIRQEKRETLELLLNETSQSLKLVRNQQVCVNRVHALTRYWYGTPTADLDSAYAEALDALANSIESCQTDRFAALLMERCRERNKESIPKFDPKLKLGSGYFDFAAMIKANSVSASLSTRTAYDFCFGLAKHFERITHNAQDEETRERNIIAWATGIKIMLVKRNGTNPASGEREDLFFLAGSMILSTLAFAPNLEDFDYLVKHNYEPLYKRLALKDIEGELSYEKVLEALAPKSIFTDEVKWCAFMLASKRPNWAWISDLDEKTVAGWRTVVGVGTETVVS